MGFRRFATTLFALAAISGAAMAQTVTIGAGASGTTVSRQASFPPIGVASSETLQINVANLATASSSGTAASCTGTIAFFGSNGSAIGTATQFTATSGQIVSASLPFSKIGASGTRGEVRAVVTLTFTAGSGVPCTLASSLETYDTGTGVTHVFLGDASELSVPGTGVRAFGR
jgi:hypothetical protein